jgi:hypothetical protein
MSDRLINLISNKDYQESVHDLLDDVVFPPSATPLMVAFEKGLEAGVCIKDDRLIASNGWLCPNGDLYACTWGSHSKVAHYFDGKIARHLNQKGFIRLSQLRFVLSEISDDWLNSHQLATIYKWHAQNGLCTKRFDRDYEQFQYRSTRR